MAILPGTSSPLRGASSAEEALWGIYCLSGTRFSLGLLPQKKLAKGLMMFPSASPLSLNSLNCRLCIINAPSRKRGQHCKSEIYQSPSDKRQSQASRLFISRRTADEQVNPQLGSVYFALLLIIVYGKTALLSIVMFPLIFPPMCPRLSPRPRTAHPPARRYRRTPSNPAAVTRRRQPRPRPLPARSRRARSR